MQVVYRRKSNTQLNGTVQLRIRHKLKYSAPRYSGETNEIVLNEIYIGGRLITKQ